MIFNYPYMQVLNIWPALSANELLRIQITFRDIDVENIALFSELLSIGKNSA